MENFDGLSFREFVESDVGLFTQIFKKAFDKDAQIHLGENGGPPGYDNGDFMKQWYLHKNSDAYAVFKDGKPVGGINVFIKETNENYLGNMFVDSEFQDMGLGLTIWRYIEQKYPETKRWRTDTPGFSTRNHNFYVNKCGFKIYQIDNPKEKNCLGYLLEKIMETK
jgi:hypothetical protein